MFKVLTLSFAPCCSISIVNYERVIAGWGTKICISPSTKRFKGTLSPVARGVEYYNFRGKLGPI